MLIISSKHIDPFEIFLYISRFQCINFGRNNEFYVTYVRNKEITYILGTFMVELPKDYIQFKTIKLKILCLTIIF